MGLVLALWARSGAGVVHLAQRPSKDLCPMSRFGGGAARGHVLVPWLAA